MSNLDEYPMNDCSQSQAVGLDTGGSIVYN